MVVGRRRSLRFGSSKGGILAEAALSVPVFLMAIFGSIDAVRGVYLNSTLQNAVHRAGRYAALDCPARPGETPVTCDAEAVRLKLQELAGVQIPAANFKLCLEGELDCATNNRGEPGDWVYLQGSIPFRSAILGHTITLSSGTLVRNEQRFTVSFAGQGNQNIQQNTVWEVF